MDLATVSSSGKAVFEDEMGPAAVSSSGKAVFEDEMGPAAVSSSGKAVFEDEMGPAAVSSSGKAVFEDEMGCRWGRSVPELVEGPTHAPHSGLDLPHSGLDLPHSWLDPESPPCHFARARRVVTSARRSAKLPHRNACSVRCAHGRGAPCADIGLWRT